MGANADLVRGMWEAFARQDPDTALALLADDAEIVAPGSLPWGGTYRGPGGYREMIGKVRALLAEFRPSPEAFIEDGDQVAVPIYAYGRTTVGTDIAWRALWLYRIADGRIVRAEQFIDTAQSLADTGQESAVGRSGR